jgi:hypothetical protein
MNRPRERILRAATSPPFVRGYLPNLRKKASRDVVALFCSHEAHDVFFGLRFLVHAPDKFFSELMSIGLQPLVHAGHGGDELRVQLVSGEAIDEHVSAHPASAIVFGIGQKLGNAQRPANLNNWAGV